MILVNIFEYSVVKKGVSRFAGQPESALQTSIAMTRYANLPFSHPCSFNVVSERMQAEGLLIADIIKNLTNHLQLASVPSFFDIVYIIYK